MTALALPEKALADAVRGLPDNALAPNRAAAMERFLERGFPTTRNEDWKYTDLAAVADISQRWLENGATAPISESLGDQVAEIRALLDIDWVVLCNGAIVDGMELAAGEGLSRRSRPLRQQRRRDVDRAWRQCRLCAHPGT